MSSRSTIAHVSEPANPEIAWQTNGWHLFDDCEVSETCLELSGSFAQFSAGNDRGCATVEIELPAAVIEAIVNAHAANKFRHQRA